MVKHIHTHYHNHFNSEKIMTKLSDLAANLAALTEQENKAKAEILAKLEELAEALLNVELTPEAEQALADLRAAVQGVDDIVPDQQPV